MSLPHGVAVTDGDGNRPEAADGVRTHHALEECYRRLRELESTVGDLSLAEHWQAGSIGIALEDTKVSGLMPFGPAFEKLEVGDVIEAVDGCEVTPGTVVSAISGENETVVQLQVRRKRDGERQTMDMVRICSARLLTAHSLAVTLHNALVLCGGALDATDSVARARADNPGQPEHSGEACELLQEGVRLLQELHQQITRSETQQRRRLDRAKKSLGLQAKQIQDSLMALSHSDEATQSVVLNELKQAKGKADQDCERLLAALRVSEDMLAQLEGRLKQAVDQLEDTENKLAASVEENKVLLDEVHRLGNKQHAALRGEAGKNKPGDEIEKELMRETIKRQDGRLDQLRSESNAYIEANSQLHEELEKLRQLSRRVDSGKENEVAQLLAENSRLKELNSSHREQLEQASEELQKAKSEAQQVRAALLQSQEDIAHLLRIADEKQASLSQAEAEKQKISKQHDQACAFADSVQDEIKRLEGLLDELRKRQAMTSVVVESLTNERDERKQEVDTAKSRIVDLELEVAGFKKLCSAQKQMLQESSNELDSLQRRLKGENGQAMPPKRQDELVHESLQPLVRAAQHQATRSSNQKPFVSNNAEVQRILQASNPTPSAQPGLETEKPASRTGSVWAQASKGISFHLDLKEVANRNQHTDIGADGKATSTSIHTQPSAQVGSRPSSAYSGGMYSVPKRPQSSSLPNSRSSSPNHHGRSGAIPPMFAYHLAQPISPRYMHGMPGIGMHIPTASASPSPVAYPSANSIHAGSISPRGVAGPVRSASARDKTAAWLQSMNGTTSSESAGIGFTVAAQTRGKQS